MTTRRTITKVEYEILYTEIAHRLLRHQEINEIAVAMSLSSEAVRNLTKKKGFKQTLDRLKEKQFGTLERELEAKGRNLRQELEDQAYKAFDLLQTLMTTAVNEGVRKDIAQDFLDRAGYDKRTPGQPTVTLNIHPVDADVIATALKKAESGRQKLKPIMELVTPASETKRPTPFDHVDNPTSKST